MLKTLETYSLIEYLSNEGSHDIFYIDDQNLKILASSQISHFRYFEWRTSKINQDQKVFDFRVLHNATKLLSWSRELKLEKWEIVPTLFFGIFCWKLNVKLAHILRIEKNCDFVFIFVWDISIRFQKSPSLRKSDKMGPSCGRTKSKFRLSFNFSSKIECETGSVPSHRISSN